MSYSQHFIAVLDAYKAAKGIPTDTALAADLGCGQSYLSNLRLTQKGSTRIMDDLVRRMCAAAPKTPEGDRVRALAAQLNVEDAA